MRRTYAPPRCAYCARPALHVWRYAFRLSGRRGTNYIRVCDDHRAAGEQTAAERGDTTKIRGGE